MLHAFAMGEALKCKESFDLELAAQRVTVVERALDSKHSLLNNVQWVARRLVGNSLIPGFVRTGSDGDLISLRTTREFKKGHGRWTILYIIDKKSGDQIRVVTCERDNDLGIDSVSFATRWVKNTGQIITGIEIEFDKGQPECAYRGYDGFTFINMQSQNPKQLMILFHDASNESFQGEILKSLARFASTGALHQELR